MGRHGSRHSVGSGLHFFKYCTFLNTVSCRILCTFGLCVAQALVSTNRVKSDHVKIGHPADAARVVPRC